jgi:hypothetical protein
VSKRRQIRGRRGAATLIAGRRLRERRRWTSPQADGRLRLEFRKAMSGSSRRKPTPGDHQYRPHRRHAAGHARTLKSDLLPVKPADADHHVELRDVFEVDGEPVRDRESRLSADPRSISAGNRTSNRSSPSAKYNISRITRTINTPLMALLFLDA